MSVEHLDTDALKAIISDHSHSVEHRRAAFREFNRRNAPQPEPSRTEYFTAGATEHDYRQMHTAPGPDETGMHELDHHANDIYTHPQYYIHSDDGTYQESMAAARRVQGRPDARVKVYRAAPPGVTQINPGDWVSPSKRYAAQHGKHHDDGSQDWPIISTVARAEHVKWDGNDINEFGYHGPPKTGMVSKPPKKGWPE